MADIKILKVNADGIYEEHKASEDSIQAKSFKTANHELTDEKMGTLIGEGDAGNLHNHDSQYYGKTSFISASEGAESAGLPIKTGTDGKVDPSLLPVAEEIDLSPYFKKDGSVQMTGDIELAKSQVPQNKIVEFQVTTYQARLNLEGVEYYDNVGAAMLDDVAYFMAQSITAANLGFTATNTGTTLRIEGLSDFAYTIVEGMTLLGVVQPYAMVAGPANLKIKGLAAGVEADEAVNKGQLDSAISTAIGEIPAVDLSPYFKRDGSQQFGGHFVMAASTPQSKVARITISPSGSNANITIKGVTVDVWGMGVQDIANQLRTAIVTEAVVESANLNGSYEIILTDPSDFSIVSNNADATITIDVPYSLGGAVNQVKGIADGTDSNDAVNKSQLDAEALARSQADANLQSLINASEGGTQWRKGVFLVSEDAELQNAVEGALVSEIMPFSDDEVPAIELSDFAAGQLLLAKNGAASKLMKVYDDEGVLKVTFVDVEVLQPKFTYIVKHDLVDSPAANEGLALYHFDGTDLFKLGDIDFSIASGINMGTFGPLSGVEEAILSTDSVAEAIHKLASSLAVVRQAGIDAIGALDFSPYFKKDGSVEMEGDIVLKSSAGGMLNQVYEVDMIGDEFQTSQLTINGYTDGQFSVTGSGVARASTFHSNFQMARDMGMKPELQGITVVYDGTSKLVISGAFAFEVTTSTPATTDVALVSDYGNVPAGPQHKIKNLAAGVDANDAVNKSQLDAVSSAIPDVSGFATKVEVDKLKGRKLLSVGAAYAVASEPVNSILVVGGNGVQQQFISLPEAMLTVEAYEIVNRRTDMLPVIVLDHVGTPILEIPFSWKSEIKSLGVMGWSHESSFVDILNPDTSSAGVMNVGQRRLTEVADATTSTDAVNKSQLDQAIQDLQDLVEAGSYPEYTQDQTLALGDLVYISGAGTVNKYSDLTINDEVAGCVITTGNEVTVAMMDYVVPGVLTGATAGTRYYWDGSALSATMPSGAGANVWLVGVAKNATDLLLKVRHVKKVAA